MREDCYAEYACGHTELDPTSMDVKETSYCNECKQPQVIVARYTTEALEAERRAWDEDMKDMAQIKREWEAYRLEGDETPPWK